MPASSDHSLHLSARSACFLMAAISIARGSSFLLSKYLLNSMEPLNQLGLVYYLCMAAELYGLKYTTSSTCSFLDKIGVFYF